MAKYIIKRLLMMIPVMIGITLFIYVILSMAPGDPAALILGPDATAEQLEAKQHELGLDQSIPVRYVKYILGVLQGNFGFSWLSGFSVFDEFSSRFPTTLVLGLMALGLSVIIGVPLGMIAAIRQNKLIDHTTLVCAMLFSCLPGFWIGMMAQLFFCMKLGWLPVSGVGSFRHFIMPSLTLSLGMMASMIRLTRTSMLEVMNKDFVRTARSKGVMELKVYAVHVLRNGLLPVITQIGIGFAGIMGGAVVTESVFAVPGIGSYLINAVKSRDIPVVMGSIIFIGLFVGIINLIVDFIYAFVDPRVKLDD